MILYLHDFSEPKAKGTPTYFIANQGAALVMKRCPSLWATLSGHLIAFVGDLDNIFLF